jgi:hypothetical protein
MNGDVQVRFCERPGGRFPGPTRLCWTEVGAECVGIFQSLLGTCRLQGIDPYTYLVDVLQRVAVHPAAKVELLTPRLWKEHFAENPLRSDLDLGIGVKNAVL